MERNLFGLCTFNLRELGVLFPPKMLHVEETTAIEDDLRLAVLVESNLEGAVLHNDLKCSTWLAVSRAYLVFSDKPSDMTRFTEGWVANKGPGSCFVVVSPQTSNLVHLDTYDTIFVCSEFEGKLDVRIDGRLDGGGKKGVGGVTKDRGRVDIVRRLPRLTGSECASRKSATAATKARLVASFKGIVLECECRRRHEQCDEKRGKPHRAIRQS